MRLWTTGDRGTHLLVVIMIRLWATGDRETHLLVVIMIRLWATGDRGTHLLVVIMMWLWATGDRGTHLLVVIMMWLWATGDRGTHLLVVIMMWLWATGDRGTHFLLPLLSTESRPETAFGVSFIPIMRPVITSSLIFAVIEPLCVGGSNSHFGHCRQRAGTTKRTDESNGSHDTKQTFCRHMTNQLDSILMSPLFARQYFNISTLRETVF